jgi:hypothetical protein
MMHGQQNINIDYYVNLSAAGQGSSSLLRFAVSYGNMTAT